MALTAALLLIMAGTFTVRARNARWFHSYDFIDPDSASFIRLVRNVERPGPAPTSDPDTWVPLGRDYRGFSLLFPEILAAAHRLVVRLRPGVSLEAVAFYYPPICAALSAIALFWALLPLIGAAAAVLAAAAWGLIPDVAGRTMVGYVDRDAMCLLLTFLVLGTYVRAMQAASLRRRLGWSALSGIAALFYQSLWAGAGLTSSMIVAAELSAWVRGRSDSEQRQRFLVWTAFLVIPSIEGAAAPYGWLATSFLNVAPAAATALLLLATPAARQIRRRLGGAGRAAPAALAAGAAALGAVALHARLAVWASRVAEMLALPMGYSRLLMTVGELRLPDRGIWEHEYAWVSLPAMCGIVALLGDRDSGRSGPMRRRIVAAWIVFLGASVGFQSSVLWTGRRWIEALYLPVGLALVAASIAPTEIAEPLDARADSPVDAAGRGAAAPLLLSWLVIGLWAARGGVRFWMFLSPVILALAAYGAARVMRRVSPSAFRPIVAAAAVTPLLGLLLGMGAAATCLLATAVVAAIAGAESDAPADRIPWRSLGGGIALAASVAALFVHWEAEIGSSTRTEVQAWYRSFGPILSRLGPALPRRAVTMAFWDKSSTLAWYLDQRTVIDSEHYLPYWIYLASRDLFGATDPGVGLRFLRAHHAEYLVITGMDLNAFTMDRWMASGRPGPPIPRLSPLEVLKTMHGPRGSVLLYAAPPADLARVLAAHAPGGPLGLARIELGIALTRAGRGGSEWQPSDSRAHYVYPHRTADRPMRIAISCGRAVSTRRRDALNGVLLAVPPDVQARAGWKLYYLAPEDLGTLTVRLFLLRQEIPGFVPVIRRSDFGLWRLVYPAGMRPDPAKLRADFSPAELSAWKNW